MGKMGLLLMYMTSKDTYAPQFLKQIGGILSWVVLVSHGPPGQL